MISIFRDHGLEPRIAQEARELQIAIGLVAAEESICLFPKSVRQSRADDVHYLELHENVTFPIIMSQRIGDQSPDLEFLSDIIVRTYQQ